MRVHVGLVLRIIVERKALDKNWHNRSMKKFTKLWHGSQREWRIEREKLMGKGALNKE